MRIAFVTGNYPAPSRPSVGTFVQQFVWAMARQGHECDVINPISLFERRYGALPPWFAAESAGGGPDVRVHRRSYLSFSSRNLGWTHTGRWTQRTFTAAAKRAVAGLPARPDLIYGHFLYPAGYAALRLGTALGRPTVIGVGESFACPDPEGPGECQPWTLEAFGVRRARRHYARRGYFLANSTPNGEMLVNLLGISSGRIRVEPNGVDLGLMHPRDRADMRAKHSIRPNGFLVAFVGSGEARKGLQRLLAAINGLPDVYCLAIGRGTEGMVSPRILRSGPVPHGIVPELLACADVFALPTTAEGSCNAIIEAMACGLPLVTSRGRYMDDLVDDEIALRVDPEDVGAIRTALTALRDNPARREQMARACLRHARKFDINARAARVTTWLAELAGKAGSP